jgi:hypothetical protein
MCFRHKRQKWIIEKWLSRDDFSDEEKVSLETFAAQFKMGNLLLFYYIEAHTDRVVASAFAMALYVNWIEKYQHKQNNKDIFVVNIPKVPLRKSKMFFQVRF